jgi:hypothetical protein
MSTEIKNQNSIPREKMKYAIIGSTIIVFIALGIGITSYYLGKRQVEQEHASPIPVIDVSRISDNHVLGASTYTWEGTVKNSTESQVVFTGSIRGSDGIVRSEQVTALIQAATQILKWDLTTPPAPTDPVGNKTVSTLSEIKPGQRIIVNAEQNFDDKREVVADSITVIMTPQPK